MYFESLVATGIYKKVMICSESRIFSVKILLHALNSVSPVVEHDLLPAAGRHRDVEQLLPGQTNGPVGELKRGVGLVEVVQALKPVDDGDGAKQDAVPGPETVLAVAYETTNVYRTY